MSVDRKSQLVPSDGYPNCRSATWTVEELIAISRQALLSMLADEPQTICANCVVLYPPKADRKGCADCGYDFDPHNATAKQTGNHHRLLALALAKRFGGWVTSDLVAHAIWPRTEDELGRKYAQHLLARAAEDELLVARELGPRELIFVLSKSGAALVSAKPATGWGRTDSTGKWHPPAKFWHDLMVARYLVDLIVKGWKVATWRELERANPCALKKPDGIAVRGSSVLWIEAERARKTGPAGRALVGALLLAANGRADRLALKLGQNPFDAPRANGAVVLLPAIGFKDDRKCNINHKLRVTNTVDKIRQAIDIPSHADIAIRFLTETKPWCWKEEIVRSGHHANNWPTGEVF